MPIGAIESISKTSIIVTTDDKAVTLTGPLVEQFATGVKLGDHLEYAFADNSTEVTSIAKAVVKPVATVTTRPRSSSPISKTPTALRDEAMQEDRYNGLRSW